MTINYEKYGIDINKKRSRRYYEAGLLNNIDEKFVEEVLEYWQKNYNKRIDPSIQIAFFELTGKKEKRVIPGNEMWNEIIPYFNDQVMEAGYRDKNIYDILINTSNSTKTVIKRVRGYYYDANNNPVNRDSVNNILFNTEPEYIIKPSDNNNGVGIEKITVYDSKMYLSEKQVTLDEIEKIYQFNFIIQKVIQQHPVMAEPHPSSVNTLRMVTLRWKGQIHYLLTFARFGSNNSVMDNAGAGGVCVGVSDTGEFLDVAIDEHCKTHTSHPTTGFEFKNLGKIPNFEKFINFVKDLHTQILHHDFVSWDIAVGIDGEPVFIEANFAGATWLYQMATRKPMFGDLTEEILEHVSNELQKGVNRDIYSRINEIRYKKLRRKNKKLKKKNKLLNKKVKKLEKEINECNKKYEQVVNSKSWKLTNIFRKK